MIAPICCRRCRVYMQANEKGDPAPHIVFATIAEAVKHVVDVHPDRAEKLLNYLLEFDNEREKLIFDVLRDHNLEGDYNP